MSVRTIEQLQSADTNQAVEIADGVWWVGHHLPDDSFQCHAYLIDCGDQSVLLDPGSALTFAHTRRKIEQVTSFERIRYFICHHQDPDIAGALGSVERLISRDDAVIVTHWRAQALLKHYGLKLPFWLIEENGWRLDLGPRSLKFVFTPYMHFPGAFCTFDEQSRVLFSSDIFGGFSEDWSLVARDESHFEALRPFHEHYMPSREVLAHGLSRLEQLPMELIAPQHGSLIPRRLIPYMIEKLKGLECGLYLTAKEDTDVFRLSRLNATLRRVLDTLILYRDFKDVAKELRSLIEDLVPAQSLEFYATWQGEDHVLRLGPSTRYRGELIPAPQICREMFGLDRVGLNERFGANYLQRHVSTSLGERPALIFPLFEPASQRVNGLAIIPLAEPIDISAETERTLAQINVPLEVAIERERLYRILEMERQQIYERSIRDQLTGLYTRVYMHEAVRRMMDLHDRDIQAPVGLVMFDIDHFKRVNDTYGHVAGDEALRRVAAVIRAQLRGSDMAVRLGGEEFGVFLAGRSATYATIVAERTRAQVSEIAFTGPLAGVGVTVSAGVALRRQGEVLEEWINRADSALYAAKRAGRNRVVTDEYPVLSL